MRVGFIGLGLMGTPLAINILKGGFELTVWNRTEVKTEPLVAAGAVRAASIGQLARSADVVITMLTDAAASEAVICAKTAFLTMPDLV
jgi:3-hydroxyisobutyrate dehydrogenase